MDELYLKDLMDSWFRFNMKRHVKHHLNKSIIGVNSPHHKSLGDVGFVEESISYIGIGKDESSSLNIKFKPLCKDVKIKATIKELEQYGHYYIGDMRHSSCVLLLNTNIIESIKKFTFEIIDGYFTPIPSDIKDIQKAIGIATRSKYGEFIEFREMKSCFLVECQFSGYENPFYFLLDESYITVDEIKTIIEKRKIKMIAKGK